MRLFKVMSALLLLLVIGSTLDSPRVAPLVAPASVASENFALELPMTCCLKATESASVYPTIDLGAVQLETQSAPGRLTTMSESGEALVWLQFTAQNRHEMKAVYITYGVVLVTMTLVLTVFLIMVIVSASKILWNFAREHIFTAKQSKRLTRLGIYVLVVGMLYNVMTLFSHFYTASHISIVGWEFVTPGLYWSHFIVGVLILLFNEMLKYSILLKEEQSLTI